MLFGRFQTRPLPHHAVDILSAAAPRDQMVMVVADLPLETSRMSSGLDPPQQARVGAHRQHVCTTASSRLAGASTMMRSSFRAFWSQSRIRSS
jgi:hypothetical protein